MANRYWVGGTANWDGTAGTKWALTSGGAGGQAVPTAADDVFFDASSGAVTCTISTGNTGAKSINCTGFTGTLTGAGDITVSGNITFVAGMTLSLTNTVTIDGTATLISGGKSYWNLAINGVGTTVTLGDAINVIITLTITSGTFTTNNYNYTGFSLSSNNSNIRSINLGSSTLTLSGGTPINFLTSTNLTFNAGTSQINLSSVGLSCNGGGVTFYNVSLTATSGTRAITGINTFNNLTLTTGVTGLSQLQLNDSQTVNGTLTCAGSSATARGFLRSNSLNTTRTLTVGTLSATDCDFRDIAIAGAAAGSSPTRAGDCGGNSGITFPAPKNVYWNLAGTQNWNATAWATTSGGTPAVNNFPLAQDTAIFDNAGAADTVDVSATTYNLPSINTANRTSAIAFNIAPSTFYGSLIFSSAVTVTGSGQSFMIGRGVNNILTAGVIIPFGLTIQVFGGSVNFLDAYNATGILLLAAGTLNAGTYNVTCVGLTSNTSTVRTIEMGSGLWTMTGAGNCWNCSPSTNLTLNKGTANILLSSSSVGAKNFSGGGLSYNKLTVGGTGINTQVISESNTFTELASIKTEAHKWTFGFGTTTTVGVWSIAGTAGNVVTLESNVFGTAFNLAKTGGGFVSSDYLSITDSSASPANTWYAGANSTNVSNNSGWIFTAAPQASGGNFLMLFS